MTEHWKWYSREGVFKEMLESLLDDLRVRVRSPFAIITRRRGLPYVMAVHGVTRSWDDLVLTSAKCFLAAIGLSILLTASFYFVRIFIWTPPASAEPSRQLTLSDVDARIIRTNDKLIELQKQTEKSAELHRFYLRDIEGLLRELIERDDLMHQRLKELGREKK